MKNNHSFSSSSIFTSYVALVALLALSLAFCILKERRIALLLFSLFLIALASRIWAEKALLDIDIEAKTKENALFAGSESHVLIKLRNNKLLPLAYLSLIAPFSRNRSLITDSRRAATKSEEAYLFSNRLYSKEIGEERLRPLRWYEECEYRIPIKAERRGKEELSSWYLATGDGLGLAESHIRLPLEDIIIYPEIIPINMNLFRRDLTLSENGPHGMTKDTIMLSTRKYQNGDKAKDINWRETAKGQGLQVNIYNAIEPKTVHLLFDGESFARSRMKSEMEKMLSIVASLLLELDRNKVNVYLSLTASSAAAALTLGEGASIHSKLKALSLYEPMEEKIEEGGVKRVEQESIFKDLEILRSNSKCAHFFYFSALKSDITRQRFTDKLSENSITVIPSSSDDTPIPYKTINAERIIRR